MKRILALCLLGLLSVGCGGLNRNISPEEMVVGPEQFLGRELYVSGYPVLRHAHTESGTYPWLSTANVLIRREVMVREFDLFSSANQQGSFLPFIQENGEPLVGSVKYTLAVHVYRDANGEFYLK